MTARIHRLETGYSPRPEERQPTVDREALTEILDVVGEIAPLLEQNVRVSVKLFSLAQKLSELKMDVKVLQSLVFTFFYFSNSFPLNLVFLKIDRFIRKVIGNI